MVIAVHHFAPLVWLVIFLAPAENERESPYRDKPEKQIQDHALRIIPTLNFFSDKKFTFSNVNF